MTDKVKVPWGEGTPWKNSTAFFTYLRGCLRKGWNTNPIKLNVLKARRKQIPNPNPRGNKATVFGATCAMCHKDYVLKEIQVDHIVPAGQLNEVGDIQGFVERLLFVTEDDLRLVCKNCNSCLSYSDKNGVSYQEAVATKQAILIVKEKRDIEWLESKRVTAGTNQKIRRQQIIDILLKEKGNDTT